MAPASATREFAIGTKQTERIVAILQESPNGLTSKQIAERLGVAAGNVSSCLSKLAAYGIIRKKLVWSWPKGKRLSSTDRRTSRVKISDNLLALADDVIGQADASARLK